MPGKNYESWESLVAAVQEKCVKILDQKVAPIAKRIVREHIESDIYGAYSPKPNGWVGSNGEPATYQRRHVLPGSLYHKFSASDEILITSNAPASRSVVKGYSFSAGSPGAFLKLLESGNMGIWRGGFARPAITNAQKEIDSSSEIRNAIEQALK